MLKTQRYRQRQREKDEAAFLQANLDQHNAWSVKNPRRVNEIAATVREKAKESQRIRCELCNHNAATQYALDYHLNTAAHAEAEKNGSKILKPVSSAALNKRASRTEAVKNRTYYCAFCDKVCDSSFALQRHYGSKNVCTLFLVRLCLFVYTRRHHHSPRGGVCNARTHTHVHTAHQTNGRYLPSSGAFSQ
ncbi:hypothetical protein BU24DRAFT_469398 [Aaosphaeria arxii CBS 175.79]|uniref:Uncharacterized protein n=1 Tax=Aaosphaeria arxii CBS 175.79 TaxID=1450172 RepID=A0A6A5Y558_9PLEO|nr:uncharacterized protein BU24DRAFT_469398 [Aaosphaeria arxii CBS 175.79]KAF2020618.1 hypothetical protein BU24DRAFT_469398 [Aaosphaeria arxii CBS 175.79]